MYQNMYKKINLIKKKLLQCFHFNFHSDGFRKKVSEPKLF